jgi:hypothetical protein
MKRILFIGLMISVFVILSHSQGYSSNALLGILEDDRSELVNWKKGPSQKRVIRPLFVKSGNEWKLSITHPERIQWIIAFDGRNPGTIQSQPNKDKTPLNIDTHIPIPKFGQILTIGKPSEEYSGWQDTLFNRPLVLVSNGSFKDPDEWKSFKPTSDQIRLLKKAFRTEYPKVSNCNENEEP